MIERINTRSTFAGNQLCEENSFSHEWHPGQPSKSIKNGRKFECKTDNHIPWWSHSCKQPTTRPNLFTTGSRHKLWATCGNIIQPFTEVRQMSLQLTWSYHFQQFLFPHILQQHLLRAPCRRNPDDRADRITIAERFGYMMTADHTIVNEGQESRCTTDLQWLCKTWRLNGFQVILAKTIQLKKRKEALRKFFRHFYGHFSGIYKSLRQTELESWKMYAAKSETDGIAERAVYDE